MIQKCILERVSKEKLIVIRRKEKKEERNKEEDNNKDKFQNCYPLKIRHGITFGHKHNPNETH
jgi:hypothetical protein